jgi:hypothetical protein
MNALTFGPPPPRRSRKGPGDTSAGLTAIIILSAVYAVIIVLVAYGLFGLWPRPTLGGVAQIDSKSSALKTSLATNEPPVAPAENSAPGKKTEVGPVANVQAGAYLDPQRGSLFGHEFQIYNEKRLFLMVLLAGALGACVHAIRSIVWYVGNRAFVSSWMLYYYLRPFTGAGLAAIFYFVIRGGFFAPTANFNETSPFGFIALASLIGLFSESAVLKLKEISDTVFSRPKPGSDAVSQGSANSPNAPATLPPAPAAGPGTAPPIAPQPKAANPPPPIPKSR